MPKPSAPPKFDPDIYTKIILNDLVVYSVHYLHKQGHAVTSDDVISACFVLFPKRFSMKKYPQYPDSAIVSRRWGDCKSKGYLRGNAVEGFQLTAKGTRRAQKVEKLLGKPLKPVRVAKARVVESTVGAKEAVHPEFKRHAKKYVRSIEMSDAYKHYRKQKPLNEFDIRSLLLTTMESPPSTLARNLEQFKEYVKIHDRRDLSAFLEFCESRFPHLFGAPPKQVGGRTGRKK